MITLEIRKTDAEHNINTESHIQIRRITYQRYFVDLSLSKQHARLDGNAAVCLQVSSSASGKHRQYISPKHWVEKQDMLLSLSAYCDVQKPCLRLTKNPG